MKCPCCGCDIRSFHRKNPDEEIRKLERLAASGDPSAKSRLRQLRRRAYRTSSSGVGLAFKWMPDESRIDLENALRQAPSPDDVPTFMDSGRVYWTKSFNSYVMVQPRKRQPGQFWHETEGLVNLYSVNGHGEVRWEVTARDVEDSYSAWGREPPGEGAAVAFGLVDEPSQYRRNPGIIGYKIYSKDRGSLQSHGKVENLTRAKEAIIRLGRSAINLTEINYDSEGNPFVGAFGFIAYAEPILDVQCHRCQVYESQVGDSFLSIDKTPFCFDCYEEIMDIYLP